MEGHCSCSRVRYRVGAKPIITHCCHCSWCQRETGSAFAVNAVVETSEIDIVFGEPETIVTPSASGKGQKIVRCAHCRVALWSHYGGGGDAIRFVRVGTLDTPDLLPPDIHIYTDSKQPWVILPEGMPAVAEYYSAKELWPAESLERVRALRR